MEVNDQLMKEAFSYRNGLLCYAFTILKDWALAEDAVQNCYLTAFRKSEDFEEGTNLFSWLKKITYYKSMELMKSRRKNNLKEESLNGLFEDLMDEEFALRQEKKNLALQKCMTGLKPDLVELLYKFYWKGVSYERLSAKTEKSVNSLRLILSRTRKSLKKCISRELQHD